METTVIRGLTLMRRLGNLNSFPRKEKTVRGSGFCRKQYAEKGG